jgi:flagellar basal-body rod modification protein FlgD
MISSKLGTVDYSKSVQQHNFGDDQQVHYSAAKPETKAANAPGSNKPGDKSVGDVLNQIANPGGGDSKPKRKAHNSLDKDDFLKLMLTQMKNQDPMNPMQSHEMAAQLAQFTSLEQLFNVNKNLDGLTKSQEPIQKFEVLNFLGKTIKADSRQILRQPGDQGSDLRFNIMADTAKVKLTIADEDGKTIKSIEYGNLKKGANKLVWAGTDDQDREVKPGKYIFNVEAEGVGGKKIGVITETKGTITGVNYTPEGPMLMVGDQKVRLQDVQKIEDDNLKMQQNKEESNPVATPKAEPAPAESVQALAKSLGQSSGKVALKPEDKERDPRLDGAVMPIEVAMGQGGSKGGAPAINSHPNFKRQHQ